jgi:hypothetical protein
VLSRAGQSKSLLSSRDALGTTAAGLRLRPIGCTRPLPWLLVLLVLLVGAGAAGGCCRCRRNPAPRVHAEPGRRVHRLDRVLKQGSRQAVEATTSVPAASVKEVRSGRPVRGCVAAAPCCFSPWRPD